MRLPIDRETRCFGAVIEGVCHEGVTHIIKHGECSYFYLRVGLSISTVLVANKTIGIHRRLSTFMHIHSHPCFIYLSKAIISTNIELQYFRPEASIYNTLYDSMWPHTAHYQVAENHLDLKTAQWTPQNPTGSRHSTFISPLPNF